MRTFTGVMIGVLVLSAGIAPGSAQAPRQPKEKEETVSSKGETGPAVAAPQTPKNSPDDTVQTRRGRFTCDVVVDNTTAWYIHRLWIDDTYMGSVARGGRLTVEDVSSGRTKLYAEADFTNGSVRRWGPRFVDCVSYSTFRWSLQ